MTDKELMQLCKGGVEVNNPGSPEYIVCAALLSRLEQSFMGFPVKLDSSLPPDQIKLVEQLEDEPVAWRTFDGEGGYEYRTYDDNENYRDEWERRNPKYKGWVEPLYAAPPRREPLSDDAVRAEREACAFEAEWCIQNHLEHLIPERIRARSKK